MSIIKVIIRLAIRVAFFFICMCQFNYGIDNSMATVLAAELATNCISLCHYSSDSLLKVIIWFDTDGGFGCCGYLDNFGLIAVGWFFWLIAFCFKLVMLHFCYFKLFYLVEEFLYNE